MKSDTEKRITYLSEDDLETIWLIAKYDYRLYDDPLWSKEEVEKNSRQLNQYLDYFINDKLSIANENFIKFSLQKETTFELIENYLEENAGEFILYGFLDYAFSNADYLFIHSIVTLEHLGYVEIKSLSAEEQKAKISVKQKFFDEIDKKNKQSNQKNVSLKLAFNGNDLLINGEIIDLSHKKMETTKAIIKTLFENEDKTRPMDFDEILENILPPDDYTELDEKEKYERKKYNKKIINGLGYVSRQIKEITGTDVEAFNTKGDVVRINSKFL